MFGLVRIAKGGLGSELRIHGAQRGHLIDNQTIILAELGFEVAQERVQGLLRGDEAVAARCAQEVRYRGSGEARGDREGLEGFSR